MAVDTPCHLGVSFAGQTLDWMPTDTQQRFNQLMQDAEYVRYIQAQGWDRPGAISYQLNSHGFRCDEFDGGPYLLALGCSYTVGIGLPVQATWPAMLAASLNLNVANLAWGGYSADTCFRLAEYWIPHLRPELVVMMAPPSARFEILLDLDLKHDHSDSPAKFDIITCQNDLLANETSWAPHWFGNEENHRLNSLRNRLAVEKLCDNHGIRCVTDTIDRHMWWSREELGYARDYLHGGPPAHQKIAEYVLGCLKP